MRPPRIDPDRLEQCACLSVRKAARSVTRTFDAALAPSGIEATQFTLLAALAGGNRSMSALADYLVMDRTTLTRNARTLIRLGLVLVRRGRDARRRVLALTVMGTRKLKEAFPLWRKQQRETVTAMGRRRFVRLLEGLGELTGRV